MKTIFIFFFSLLLMACAKNQVTGRKQLSLVSENDLQSMSKQEYTKFLSQNKVVGPGSSKDAEMVTRIGNRIATAISDYYNSKGKSSVLKGYNWEFNLVDSKDVNAWCMPGGKVVVYTGILAVTQNEDALAVVMGHEITHALAKHGNERMSQGMLQQVGGVALQVALASKPAVTQNLFMNAYGIGTNVGALLPFSREQELEADHHGLIFAAMAGYNPQEAVPFWERMSKTGGSKPAEFLSTHPSDARRISKLKKLMPEAMKYYKPA